MTQRFGTCIPFTGLVLLLIVGCSQNSGNAEDAMWTKEKPAIDNQFALVDVLPQTVADYCKSTARLKDILRLTTLAQGHRYIIDRQAEMQRQIDDKTAELIRALLQSEFTQDRLNVELQGAVRTQLGEDWQIVSRPSVQDAGSTTKTVVITQKLKTTLSLADRGFFTDKYKSKNALVTITASPSCESAGPPHVVYQVDVDLTD